MVSLWGLLTRTVTTNSAAMKIARSSMPIMRKRIGIAAPGPLPSGVVVWASLSELTGMGGTSLLAPTLEPHAPKRPTAPGITNSTPFVM
jgi:hypothetical protein